jgi:Gp157 protein
MSGLSLYNIAEELVALKQLRDDAEYEADAEAVKVIDGQIQEWVRGCLATKADGIRGYLSQLDRQIVTWQGEAERFKALSNSAKNQYKRLSGYVLDAMRLLDAKKIEGSKGDVLLRRRGNGGVKPLVIAQPDLVPPKMQTVSVRMSLEYWEHIRDMMRVNGIMCEASKPEPNNQMIRAALERGEGVPGCCLDDRGEHLVVE